MVANGTRGKDVLGQVLFRKPINAAVGILKDAVAHGCDRRRVVLILLQIVAPSANIAVAGPIRIRIARFDIGIQILHQRGLLQMVERLFPTHIEVVVGGKARIRLGAFERYQYHTASRTRTIDGRTGGIFQHRHALDVFGVERADIAFNVVYQHKRCASVNRKRATHIHRLGKARPRTAANGKSRHGSLQRGSCINNRPVAQHVAHFHLRHRTR